MADLKISQLTAITTLTPATDVLPVVDVTGTTKKITTNQILGSGGTATLASATISGDLTVDTSTLKVDSVNNRVGVVNASPAYPLDVTGIINTNSDAYVQGGRLALYRPAGSSYIDIASGQDLVFRGGLTTVGGAGASDLMRLNSSGLGVGGSVLAKISAYLTSTATYNSAAAGDDTDFQISRVNNSTVSGQSSTIALNSSSDNGASVARVYLACVQESNGSYASSFTVKTRNSAGTNAERLRIDSSGNVGIGITPSAWDSGFQVIENSGGSLWSGSTGAVRLSQNAYYATSLKYKNALAASQYVQTSGQHQWFYDSGTRVVGTACNFVQAMTLDASGNLLVGTTGSNGSISNASYVVGGIFSTLNGILSSVATATPTTLFAAPSESTLMVTAYVNGASPSDYKVVAVVKRGGAAVAITTISSATGITITASGTNIQVTQTSGGTQNVYFNVIRLA